jgi:aerotaxis receptor
MPHDLLVGSAHNIVRHPQMPAGAFKIIWDMLNRQEATCAYVNNLAGDGSAYWAFATIMPIPGGYLSVRSRPMRDVAELEAVYNGVRADELAARQQGSSAAEAARVGAGRLAIELKRLGVESYEDFMLQALPEEVIARSAAASSSRSALHRFGQYGPLLDKVDDMTGQLRRLVVDLWEIRHDDVELTRLAEESRGTVQVLHETLARCSEAISRLAERAPVVANSAPALAAQVRRVEESMTSMAAEVEHLRSRRARLRFSVAMSQLQTECIGCYTVGLIEHQERKSDSRQAISALSDALHLALARLQEEVRVNAELHERVDEVSSGFRRIQQTLGQWRTLIERYGVGDLVGENLPVLDAALADGVEQLHRLSELSDRFATATKGFDPAAVDGDLAAVSTLIEAVD